MVQLRPRSEEHRARGGAPRDDLAIFRWIWRSLGPRTRRLVLVIGAFALVGRLGALGAALLVAQGRTTLASLTALATAAVFVTRRALATRTRVDAEADLHTAVSKGILDGDVVEELMVEPHFVLSEGIHSSTDFVVNKASALGAEIVAASFAVGALATVMTIDLFVLVAVGGITVGVVTLALRHRVARLHARAVDAQQRLNEAFAAVLHGRLELVSSGLEQRGLEGVEAAARSFRSTAKRTAIAAAVLGRTPIAAAMAVCGAIAFARVPSLGEWLARVSFDSTAGPLIVMGTAIPILLGVPFGLEEMVRLREHLAPFAQVVLRPVRPDVVRRRGDAAPHAPEAIRFDEVSFAYRVGSPLVLDRSSAAYGRGVTVLAGPNGSGKSTVLRLVLGLREPSAGSISVDAVELRDVDVSRLRRRIAFLPQRPYLGEPYWTVEEALTFLAPQASRARMLEALDRVGFFEGMSTTARDAVLGRTVGELSVGQRQKLAIGRALLRDTPVVLLDEPDANLDADGLRRLVDVVEELARDRIVIVSAHGPIARELAHSKGASFVDLGAGEDSHPRVVQGGLESAGS